MATPVVHKNEYLYTYCTRTGRARRLPAAALALAALGLAALGVSPGAHAAGPAPAAAPPATAATQPTSFPAHAVLDGVPRIGYDVHLCPFPGSLLAALDYLGDPQDYDFLMATSGACFRRFWNKSDGGNVDLMYLQPEPHQRVFRALGYSFRMAPNTDRAAMLGLIRESIAEGKPALAFGIIGPPEAGLVTGYDRNGDVLLGYSYFEDSRRGYYTRDDWFDRMDKGCPVGVLLIGSRGTLPSARETLISTLKWAIDLETTAKRAEKPDHSAGLAAYDGWADCLDNDADFATDKDLDTRAMVHGDQCAMLAERGDAAAYLKKMADQVPEAADELNAAAGLYQQTADQMRVCWPFGPGMTPAAVRGLKDPATRHKIASGVRAAKASETQAVGHLEKALAILERTRSMDEPK